ncbi:MAG: AAA family ATPase, partial [Hymenobacter sp.]
MSLPHLLPEAAAMLGLPVAERKGKIREMKWIPYARARRIEQKMHDLLHHPPSYRMPNLLVVGDTGNGKTHIIKRFAEVHP